jgi:pyruvate formate lyase activating enzyme
MDELSPKATQGRIFDIQRYSIHDGPGIRTIVFFKGCPLRCRWCCNPESQQWEIQTLREGGAEKQAGRDVTAAEVLAVVERDRPYYRRSGGGLTLSGGEALCQPAFAETLLRAAKTAGLSTALETTAAVPWPVLEKILPWLDHCLLDIKHMDAAKHETFTGRPNGLILENAAKLARAAPGGLTLRVPVVPGFNDTEEEIGHIAAFAKGLGRDGAMVRALHLLPYHRLGSGKYAALGRPYPMGDLPPPSPARMARLQALAASVSGLPCQVGG